MSADFARLLHEAAGTPRRALDLERLEAAARRRRLRRRAGGALAALVVLAGLAVAVPALVQPRVVVDTPAEDGGWPVLVGYTEVRPDEGWATHWEVAARHWVSWTMVEGPRVDLDADGEPAAGPGGGLGTALAREGEARWFGTTFHLDAADREGTFDLVEEALADRWAERYPVDEHPDGAEAWRPLVAFEPVPADPDDVATDAVVADDLPDLRDDVAARLRLDPDRLMGFTVERDDGAHVTWVRHVPTGLPLHYEEAVPAPQADGNGALEPRVRIEATEIRFDVALPEHPTPDTEPTEDEPVEDPVEDEVEAEPTAGDWRTLPDAPVAGRIDAGAVWSGTELLVWGGKPSAAGAAYDPTSDSWRMLPDAPLDAREGHVAVWTGAELVVWGGSAYAEPDDPGDPVPAGADIGDLRADGAAYDPATDTWRTLPDAPLDPRTQAAAVWTGEELLVVAGVGEGSDPGTTEDLVDGAAYDPATDAWRTLPDLPELAAGSLREVGRDAVWTGEEMLVGGSRFAPGVVAAYDPTADSWRLIEDGPPAGGGGFVAWTGTEAILTDTMTIGPDSQPGSLAVYDVAADAWRTLPAPPVEMLAAVTFVMADDRLLALGGLADHDDAVPMGAWVLDPADERWHELDEPPVGDRGNPAAVWTGTDLLVWGGMAVAVGDETAAHDDGAVWRPALVDE